MTERQKILAISLGTVLTLGIIGLTYAFFSANIKNYTTAVTVETNQVANLTMTSIKSEGSNPIYPGWVGYQALDVAASGVGSAIYDLSLNITGGQNIKNDVQIEVCKIVNTTTALAISQITYTAALPQVDTTSNVAKYYMSGGNVTLPSGCATVVSETSLSNLGESRLISGKIGKEISAGYHDRYYIKLTYTNNTNNSQIMGETFTITPNISARAELGTIDFSTYAAGFYTMEGEQIYSWDELISNNYLVVTDNQLSKGGQSSVLFNQIGALVISSNVTSIAPSTFSYWNKLKLVSIPNSVTSIGQSAFNGCTGLTSITIPNSVTSIGYSAFKGCTGLTSVTINAGSISDSAFFGCINLTTITIGSDVTNVDPFSFYGSKNVANIIVDDNNTIYDSRNNSNAIIESDTNTLIFGCKNSTIPNSVTSIGLNAFKGCTDLTSITIPNSVTSIDQSAFSGCTGLTSITIPNSVTSIGHSAFNGCTGLTSATINGSSIGQFAFNGCTGLTSATINAGSISTSAFYGCINLTTITIGSDVTNVHPLSFSGSKNVANIIVDDNNTIYDSRNNSNAIIESDTNTLIFGCKNSTIPNSVTSIGQNAFRGCTDLTSITIPNSVTSIGESAFYGCTGLTSITIPNSVTSIDLSAFNGCTGLTSITIPNSVTSIGQYAFSGCTGLTSATINAGSINQQAFYRCTGLTSVTIGSDVTSINNNAFDIVNLANIIVDSDNTVYDSRNNSNAIIESDTNTLIVGGVNTTIPNDVTSIGNNAFYGRTSLTSITIPLSITSIGQYAFGGCNNLSVVNYYGSSDQWNQITIGNYNNPLMNATKVYNYSEQ